MSRERTKFPIELRAVSHTFGDSVENLGHIAARALVKLGLIYLVNPSYLKPLTNTTLGTFLLVLSGCMIAAGSWVMTRIARIEV